MDIPAKDSFYVAEWRVEPGLNQITNRHEVRRLEPLVMQLLVRLADHPGEVIPKDDLITAVWGEGVITDNVLARAVAALRKALDDDWRNPRFIETISKKGYRLIAPVTRDGSDEPQPRPSAGVPEIRPLSLSSGDALDRARKRTWISPGTLILWGAGLLLLLSSLAWLLRRGSSSAISASTLSPIPLTTFAGSEIQPALSPDGHQLAFVWDGPTQDNWDLYIKRIGTETVLRLTHHPAAEGNPAWSPDGRYLAFIRYGADECGLYRVAALGGDPRKLGVCSNAASVHPAWSPDGAWIALDDVAPGQGGSHISLLSTRTFETVPLTFPAPAMRGDTHPVFSLDGTHLVFRRIQSEGLHDLFAVPMTGGTPRQLTFVNRNIDGHGWHPGGQRIIFSSNRNGLYQLWQIPSAGGLPEVLPISDYNLHKPSLARSQNRLVYARSIVQTNLWALKTNQARVVSVEPLITSTGWDLHPQISPNSAKIAFSSNRSGFYEVWVSDFQESMPLKLTAFEGPFTGTPRWSPDSERLVFDARPEDHADLFVIDAAGGYPQRLTTDTADDLAASWSHDGRSIYFSSNRSGSWQVWTMPAEGGQAVQVTREGGFGPQASPDGRYVYFAKRKEAGLWRVPVQGGPEEKILEDLASLDWGNWVIVPRGIYYLKRSPTALLFAEGETTETRTIYRPPKPVPTMDVALSASQDGQWLVLGQIDHSESDIMLVEGFR